MDVILRSGVLATRLKASNTILSAKLKSFARAAIIAEPTRANAVQIYKSGPIGAISVNSGVGG